MKPSIPSGGPSRYIFFAGLLAAFAGFAIFAFAVVSTLAEFFSSFGEITSDPNNLENTAADFSRIGRLLPIAFGLMIPGIIVAGLASAFAAREEAKYDVHIGDRYGDRATVARDGGYIHMEKSHNTYINVALQDLHSVQDIVSKLKLPPDVREQILAYLADAEREYGNDQPDETRVGDRLTRATILLQKWGALAKVGSDLLPLLRNLAMMLGPAGAALMGLLR